MLKAMNKVIKMASFNSFINLWKHFMKNPLNFSNQKKSLISAINAAGCRRALADSLGVTTQIIYLWLKAYDNCDHKSMIPPKRAIQVEKATNHAVTRSQLRPDIFGEKEISPLEKLSEALSMANEAISDLQKINKKRNK